MRCILKKISRHSVSSLPALSRSSNSHITKANNNISLRRMKKHQRSKTLNVTCVVAMELSSGTGDAVSLVRSIRAIVIPIAEISARDAASSAVAFEPPRRAGTPGLVRPVPAVVVPVAPVALGKAASVAAGEKSQVETSFA